MKRPLPSGRPFASGRQARGRRARRLGRWAEAICVLSLGLRGWRILGRGVTAGRGHGIGEIDIVARRGGVLAFIEVKARPSMADAAGAVSSHQRARLARAAAAFLARRPDLAGCAARFDAMLVAPWRMPRHVTDAWRDEA